MQLLCSEGARLFLTAALAATLILPFFQGGAWGAGPMAPRVQSITMDVAIDPSKQDFSASAVISVNTEKAGDAWFFFDAKCFEILELVNEAGERIRHSGSGGLVLHDLPAGRHTYTLKYRLRPEIASTSNAFTLKGDLVEFWDTFQWHPNLGRLQAIDYSMSLRIPKRSNLQVVSCGDLIEKKEAGENIVHRWHAPHTKNSLSLFAAPYSVVTKKHGKVTYSVYSLKSNPEHSRAIIEYVRNVIEFMDRTYYPFPYNCYTIIETPGIGPRVGRGINSLCMLGSEVFQEFAELVRTDVFIPHEISHTYWGSVIDPYLFGPDAGLNTLFFTEALAHYTAVDFNRKRGDKFAEQMCLFRISKDFYANRSDNTPLQIKGVPLEKLNRLTVSSRLALLHFYLSELIGWESYHKALRAFVARNAWSGASFSDFIAELKKHYGNAEKLQSFVDAWLEPSARLIPKGVELFFPGSRK